MRAGSAEISCARPCLENRASNRVSNVYLTMQNRLYILLQKHMHLISTNHNVPTPISILSQSVNALIACVLHELHLLHNPYATSIIACLDGISTTQHAHFVNHFTTVLLVSNTTHTIHDCASWKVGDLPASSVFVLLFQRDYDDDTTSVDDAVSCVSACSSASNGLKKEESITSLGKKEEPSAPGDKKEEHISAATSDRSPSVLSDFILPPGSFATAPSVASEPSLASLMLSDNDTSPTSTCSYDVQRVDANVVLTRAMAKQKEAQQVETNKQNQEFGFHPIPFGERVMLMQHATKPIVGPLSQGEQERGPILVPLLPNLQGGPAHDKYNDDLVNEGNPIAKICNNLVRRFDRIGKSVTCSCEVRKKCQSNAHIDNACELCTKQVRQPKFHHAKASFVARDNNNTEGTGCVDLLCRGHRDLVMVLVVSISETNFVLALPVKSKKTKDLLPVIWQLFSLSRYFYGVAIWRLHGDRESALFHSRSELAPILCTFTISGDHAANPVSERFNRTLSIVASKSLSHLTSSATRKNLWSRAVTHAAFSISMKNMHQVEMKDRRLSNQTIVPFLALGTVPPHLGSKPSRTEERNVYALYLAPCDLSPLASLVLLIDYDKQSATSTSCRGTKIISSRGFNPLTDGDQYSLLPNVSFCGKEKDEIAVICTICSMQRFMEPDQHEGVMERFPDGNFNCSETNATCGEEQWESCRIRVGPLRGSQNRLGKKKAALAVVSSNTAPDASSSNRIPTRSADSSAHVMATDINDDDNFLVDAEYLPDFNHGINADIDEMMESTRHSLHDMSAFKANLTANLSTDSAGESFVGLTKLLTEKRELEAVESRESIKVEANQLFNVDRVVAPPVEQDQALAENPDATASPAMLIVSIKNYEFMLARKEIKAKVNLARAELLQECNAIREEYGEVENDSKRVLHSLSGLACDSTLKRRVESAIAFEARIKELDDIAELIQVENAQDDGEHFVPQEFTADTSGEAMKGASSAEPKWKCRVVVRGDIVQRLDEFINKPTFRPVKPGDDAPSVWSPTVSLSGFRAVVAHSVLHKCELRSLDLPSAFVQVSWPSHLPPHYLKFPDNIREVLSDEFQGKNLKSPVWQMLKMIYGHRLSGWTFCKRLQDILLANGFVACDWCNAVMVHPEKNICICTYVDDLAFSCDSSGEVFLMNCIREGGLKIGDAAETCKKYLGTKLTVIRGDRETTVRFDQHEYAVAICEMYRELYGKLPHKRKFPGSWNANVTAEPQRDVHRASSRDTGNISEEADRRRRQVLIGMLLWHARSVRCDIAGYVNFLATRIHVWTSRDDTFLAQLIGFLRFSAAKALTWSVPHDVDLSVNVLFDANLHVPRSQCSYCVTLGNSSNQCYALIDWSNKRAKLSCTASAASELCAAHYTTANVTGMCQFLDQCIDTSDSTREFPDTNYQLLGDNVSSLLIIQKGFSPMAGAWASNRAYGLRLAVMHQQHVFRVFRLGHVRSAVNLADLASKVCHSRETFLLLSELCGLTFGRQRFVIPIERDSAPNRRLVCSLT